MQAERGVAAVTGSTDNQGNAYAVRQAMSTKYPLALLLMELSEEMRDQQVVLDLRWTPRESNQEADDLSNLKVGAFDPGLRIRAGPGLVKFIVLDELMEASAKLHGQLVQERAMRTASRATATRASRGRKQRQVLSAWWAARPRRLQCSRGQSHFFGRVRQGAFRDLQRGKPPGSPSLVRCSSRHLRWQFCSDG